MEIAVSSYPNSYEAVTTIFCTWHILFEYLLQPDNQEMNMTSSNGNIFRITVRLCGELIGHRWIPRTKGSDAELWCFLSSHENVCFSGGSGMIQGCFNMMTSSNGNILRVTGYLCGEFTCHRWIPHTKASDVELWFFFICVWIDGWINNHEAGDLRH